MAILKLNHPGTRAAMCHPALRGKKRIGRGFFAAVYDNGDTILKMTCDSRAYEFHCDMGGLHVDGNIHFARVIEDHGCIGHQGDLRINLMEMEKLEKLAPATPQKKFAKKLERHCAKMLMSKQPAFERLHGRVDHSRIVPETLYQLSENEAEYGETMCNAFERLASFSMNYEHVCLDIHSGNIMVRPGTGDIILMDPIADAKLLATSRGR